VTCDRSVIFSGSPVSSTDKTGRQDTTEILLKVAFNTIKKTQTYYPTYKQNNYFRTHFMKPGKSSHREVTAIYIQE
jgi:hypothetical protein